MRKKHSTKKKYAILLIFSAVLTATAVWRLTAAPTLARAEELLQSLEAEELDFSLTADVTLADGTVTPYWQLTGHLQGEDSILSGTVLGQPVEMCCQDGVLQRTLPDGTKTECRLDDPGQLGQLYAELLPVSAFAYQEVAGYGAERRPGGWSLYLTPTAADGWVGEYFQQVSYLLETGPLGRRLRAAELQALERINGQAQLHMRLELL